MPSQFDGAYVPDVVSDTDLEYLRKGQFGGRRGWGDAPALVIVDLTRQFSQESYPLGRGDTGEDAVRGNRELLDAARSGEVPVIYIKGLERGDRFPDGETEGEERVFDPGEGNDIRPEIAPEEGDIVMKKPGRSAFFGTRLDPILRSNGIDTIIVTGMVTSGCVRATVVDGFQHGYSVVVPIEAVADRSQISHEVALFDMDMKYADVMGVPAVAGRLTDA